MEKKVCDQLYPECFVCSQFVHKGLVVHHTNNFYHQYYFCSVVCLLKVNQWHLENPPDINISDRNEGRKDQSTQTNDVYHPCKSNQRFICQMFQQHD